MRSFGIVACLVLALVNSLVQPSSAQGAGDRATDKELTDALIAYVHEDFPAAFRRLLLLAQRNVPLAQMLVGRLFADGLGTTQNCELAVEWLVQAAQQGIADAALDLASFSEQGRCLPRNISQAIYWYTLAANYGDARAPNAIGEIYLSRADVPRDLGKAIFWFERAAMLFDAKACYHLGELYASGQGGPEDLIEAYKWFDLAASLSAAEQMDGITEGAVARDRIREVLMPPQVTEGQRRASDFRAQLIIRQNDRPMRWNAMSQR